MILYNYRRTLKVQRNSYLVRSTSKFPDLNLDLQLYSCNNTKFNIFNILVFRIPQYIVHLYLGTKTHACIVYIAVDACMHARMCMLARARDPRDQQKRSPKENYPVIPLF